MLKKKTILAVMLVLTASAATRARTQEEGAEAASGASVPAVELKVGPAHVSGFVSFVLSTSVNGDTVSIEAVVDQAPLGASEKAEVVAAAVAAEPSGSWRAAGDGGRLSFQHLVDDTWENVDLVSNLTDTTGAGTKLKSSDWRWPSRSASTRPRSPWATTRWASRPSSRCP